MRTFRPTLAALAVSAALAAPSASAQFSNSFVFGDSLADAGQYGARFTTNPGLVFPMYLAQRYGITVSPSFTGGTDYAQGGAYVNGPSPLVPAGAPNFGVAQQVSQFLAVGAPNPNALYQIDGGGNNINGLVGQFLAGQITQAQLQGAVGQAALDLATQAARLQAAGARYIVLYNVPDIGKTPDAAAAGVQSSGTALAGLFNTTLNAAVQTGNLQVIQVDLFKLQNEIIANPAAFGLTNVTGRACTTSSSLTCTPATLVSPTAPLTYFFADGQHPTTIIGEVVAAATASMIEGPAKVGTIAEAPLEVEEANWRALDGRMMSGLNTPRAPNKFETWVAYDYQSVDTSSLFVNGSGNQNTIALGGDMKLSDKLLVGLAFGYSENKTDFGDSTGNFKLRETSGTAYAGYGDGPWYIGATLGGGDLDYSNVTREFALGPATRTESGRTNGWQLNASVLGGYWFNYQNLTHGPFVRFRYSDIHVDGYSEDGSDSTALSYSDQKRTSFISTLGWQLSGQVGAVRPFARVAWEMESKDDQRFVSATPVGLSGTYSIPTIKPDRDWVRYQLGASMDFGKVVGYLVGEGTSGVSTGNGYAITVGMRVPI